MPLPTILASDLDSQPSPFRAMREEMRGRGPDSIAHQLHPPMEALRKQLVHYAANVSMIDCKVEEILKTLQHEGYLDNCVVVFMSDHGDQLDRARPVYQVDNVRVGGPGAFNLLEPGARSCRAAGEQTCPTHGCRPDTSRTCRHSPIGIPGSNVPDAGIRRRIFRRPRVCLLRAWPRQAPNTSPWSAPQTGSWSTSTTSTKASCLICNKDPAEQVTFTAGIVNSECRNFLDFTLLCYKSVVKRFRERRPAIWSLHDVRLLCGWAG